MPRCSLALLMLTLLVAASCESPPREPYLSGWLPFIRPADLACVVLVSGPNGSDGTVVGSAIVLDARRLLTARHVIEPLQTAGSDSLLLNIDFDRLEVRMVAAGDAGDPHGDWAILELPAPRWRESDFAHVHGPAREPDWQPAADTEIIIAGYGTRFFKDRMVDPRVAAPLVQTTVVPPLADTDPEQITWFGADRRMELAGMSGGPVFVWDRDSRRLELIGVVVSQILIEREISGLFGFSMPLGSERAISFVRLPAAIGSRRPADPGR